MTGRFCIHLRACILSYFAPVIWAWRRVRAVRRALMARYPDVPLARQPDIG